MQNLLEFEMQNSKIRKQNKNLFLLKKGLMINVFLYKYKMFISKQGIFVPIFISEKYMYSRAKKKTKNPIYFNTNYRTEVKLVPIIMDDCLLQFNA